MALSASGIGSGLDINGLVSQLMALEQRPLTLLQTKEASFQSRLSAFGQLKSALATLQTAADALKDPAKFSATKATVADGTLLTATSSTAAAAGSYSVKVDALAAAQRIATSANAAFTPAAGDITVTFGTIANGVFTPSEAAKTLTFAGGTLEELRDAINKGSLGIKASVIDNGTVKQLVLTGAATGSAQAFSIGGTAGLAYDPTSMTTSTDPVYRVQAAQDARVEVDGLVVTRPNNTINDVIEGVTLALNRTDPAATTVTVAEDKGGAKSAIDALVKAYNDINTTIKNLTAFNAETRTGSVLTGDSTARSVQSQLRSLLGTPLSGLPGVSSLSEIGVAFKSDGTLAVDATKLDAALKDPAKGVAALFTGSGDVKGLAAVVSSRLEAYLDSDGLIAARTEGINASIKALGKQQEALARRLEMIEKRYMAQFTALDSMVASMQQTSTFLTQQLANLPKISSSNDN